MNRIAEEAFECGLIISAEVAELPEIVVDAEEPGHRKIGGLISSAWAAACAEFDDPEAAAEMAARMVCAVLAAATASA